MESTPEQSEPAGDGVMSHEPEARPGYAEKVAFLGHLVFEVPALRETFARHLLDAEGEMLPHLLMQDIVEWMHAGVADGITPEVRRALAVLDEGFARGSDAFVTFLAVSFLEELPGFGGKPVDATTGGHHLRLYLGPHLSNALVQLEQMRREGSTPAG